MTLQQALDQVRQPDRQAMAEAQRRLDSIIKPLSSLGKLETHLVKIAGITGSARFDLSKKAVVVFCADNGIVAQGVTQSGQEVTAIVAANLTTGETCVCAMAGVAGADVIPVDIGINAEIDLPGLLPHKIAFGTKDFSQQPAMTRQEAVAAVEVGIQLAVSLEATGYRMLATGEMGIGNTTTSSAVASVMMGVPPHTVTGPGAGLSAEGVSRKISLIQQAIVLHRPDPADPIDVLAKVGGLDIAGMAGLCIGGAVAGIPVVLDGFVSTAAAMIACGLCQGLEEFLLPSHVSAEPAGRAAIEFLGFSPPLEAAMRLGEGTGAVATFPMYDMIAQVYDTMVDFSDENMAPYQPL